MRQTNGLVSAKLLQYQQQIKQEHLGTLTADRQAGELVQNVEGLLEMDFAQNFNCVAVGEVHHKRISLFTISFDGSSSRFKNKLTAATLFEEKLQIKLFWNFIPTSHGKYDVDGIEASIILNLFSFYQLQFLSKQVTCFSSSQDGYKTLKVVHGKIGKKIHLNESTVMEMPILMYGCQ